MDTGKVKGNYTIRSLVLELWADIGVAVVMSVVVLVVLAVTC